MEVQVIQGVRTIIQVSGEVDLSNVGDLHAAILDAAARSPAGFVIDMSATYYIDSAGIAEIMAAYQDLRSREGRLALVAANRNIKDLLSLVHPEALPGMYLCETLAEAERVISC